MLPLQFLLPAGRAPRVMFIGAHADDIEIGCGGTVIELLRRHPDAQVHWCVLSAEGPRRAEARHAARALLRGSRGAVLDLQDFRGAHFPVEWAAIKAHFESLKAFRPDLVFCHDREDLHQDHRIVGELAWNTFRDHVVLEYEIPKYDGGLRQPSLFVNLGARTRRRKIDLLMKAFPSQHARQWFTPSTFEGLMRLRGIECNAPDGHAEAFTARKLTLWGA
jgi:LmbE family N-acetylglucosaminyl deacetylase